MFERLVFKPAGVLCSDAWNAEQRILRGLFPAGASILSTSVLWHRLPVVNTHFTTRVIAHPAGRLFQSARLYLPRQGEQYYV